jgi:hypothetical protein
MSSGRGKPSGTWMERWDRLYPDVFSHDLPNPGSS